MLLYNLVEGQMEKLHVSVQLHNTAPVFPKDSLKSCIATNSDQIT